VVPPVNNNILLIALRLFINIFILKICISW